MHPSPWPESQAPSALARILPRAAAEEVGEYRPMWNSVYEAGSTPAGNWTREAEAAVPATHHRPFENEVPVAATHEDVYGIRSLVFESRRPFDREKFLALTRQGLPAGLLRAKGFFWLAQQPADIGFLSVAGGVARTEFVGTWVAELRERGVITDAEIPAAARARWVEPTGDRRQELVFIGTGLDEAGWRRTLEGCLA